MNRENKFWAMMFLCFTIGILTNSFWAWLFSPYQFRPTPSLAVDIIVECPNNKILLIQRKYHPAGVALPGGFVEIGEPVEFAAVRELKEETNLHASIADCEQYHFYSDPARDPRGHTASVAFICKLDQCEQAEAGDDAAAIEFFNEKEIPWKYMVFDHGVILRDYFAKQYPRWSWLETAPRRNK